MYDAICYDGWITTTSLDPFGACFPVEVMDKCDDELRSCNETVTICWDDALQEYVITRVGSSMIGPACRLPCHTNCEY